MLTNIDTDADTDKYLKYKQKYLKYKQKYLKLKKSLIDIKYKINQYANGQITNVKIFYIKNSSNSLDKPLKEEIQLDLSDIDDEGYILEILVNKIIKYMTTKYDNIDKSDLLKIDDIQISKSENITNLNIIKDLTANKIESNTTYYFKIVKV